MSVLDAARNAVRALSWALAIGTVAAIANAVVVVMLASAWPQSSGARAALLAVVQAAIVFAIAWLAGLAIQLEVSWGALAGLWAAALPMVIVLAVEGPLGLEPQLGLRIAGTAIATASGAAAALVHRRRAGDASGGGKA